MKLTQDQQDLLDGKFGEGAKLAMKVQVAIGESFGAERMVPITRAHVALSNQDADRWLAEKLAGLGAKCRVRPTVNPGFCLSYFKKMGVVTNKDYEEMERTDRAYRALGAELSYNCTPYMFLNMAFFLMKTVMAISSYRSRRILNAMQTTISLVCAGRRLVMGFRFLPDCQRILPRKRSAT